MRRIAFIAIAVAAVAACAAAAPARRYATKPPVQQHRAKVAPVRRAHPGVRTHRTSKLHGVGVHRIVSHSSRYQAALRVRHAAAVRARYEAELRVRHAAELRARYDAVLRDRYNAGYEAGYAAGRAASRKDAAMACRASPNQSVPGTSPRALSTPSADPGHRDALTAASRVEVASDAGSAGMTPALHRPPITVEASLQMLHGPMPRPLYGSLASLERQDRRLEAEGLRPIENDSDLEYRIDHKRLAPLPVSAGLTVNPRLPVMRRYCQPWTAEFLSDLAQMHDAAFHRPFRVDSAVRTVAFQRRLRRTNVNAAPAIGPIASPHELGASIDIGKKGMSWREIAWMRRYLLTLQNEGVIDVEEEFKQACFHITVYDTYGDMRPVRGIAENATGRYDNSLGAPGTAEDGGEGQ